ncbi:MAG TPA: rhomboid family intramembrane serine protease [Nitrosopumilaceae archaeon]|nr:rhomboid family intramembrane serine protease [Nitrosopumilaceae archaeon]
MFLKLSSPSPITLLLIIVNGVIFAYGTLSNSQDQIISHYGFVPDNLFRYNHPLSDDIIRLFSSMFIHANIAHIAFNLLALAYLGGFAERSIGIPRYLLIYLSAGVSGALLHGIIASFILGNGSSVLIGASGAISGIMGITAALGDIRGYYWLAIQILFAFVGSFASISIAFMAHVGGFIAGLLLTKLLIEIERKKRKGYWSYSQ